MGHGPKDLFSGQLFADLIGVELKNLYLTYDDTKKCNLYRACVKALGPEFRVRLETLLLPPMGINWALAYVVYIWYGFKKKKCYMPLFPLLLNLSWEFIFTLVFNERFTLGFIIIPFCFLLDCLLLVTFILYGEKQLPKLIQKSSRYAKVLYVMCLFALCYFFVITVSIQFEDYIGNAIAFFQNAIMSLIFLLEYFDRDSLEDTDNVDAVGAMMRFTGSLPVTVYMFLIYDSSEDEWWGKSGILLFYVLLVMTVCDVIYTVLTFYYNLKRDFWPKRGKYLRKIIPRFVKKHRVFEEKAPKWLTKGIELDSEEESSSDFFSDVEVDEEVAELETGVV